MLHCPLCGRRYPADMHQCPEDGTALQADGTINDAATAATTTTTTTDPLVGRVLDDKYRLDHRLGEGGMGTVYRATHLLIDRFVAVKVLNPRFVTDEAARERLRREARAAGRLRHANAVAVTDFGQTGDGIVYIVMELLEGQSLREILTRDAPLSSAQAMFLMMQTAAAVAAAHEAGIIHRDLKPGNIFVVERRHAPPLVKVLDFGIAKIAADASRAALAEEHPQTLTQTGMMIGTPRYMSPEQCDDSLQLTPASDVYSLGVIFYEMLAGTAPFNGASPLAIAMKHSSELPRRPSEIVAAIPPVLERIALHALEKNAADRPPNANAFHQELAAAAATLNLESQTGFSGSLPETQLRAAETTAPQTHKDTHKERLPTQEQDVPITNEAESYETIAVVNSSLAAGSSHTSAGNKKGAAARTTSPAAATPQLDGSLAQRRSVWNRASGSPVLIGVAVGAVLLFVLLLSLSFITPRRSATTLGTTPATTLGEAPLAATQAGLPERKDVGAKEQVGGREDVGRSLTTSESETATSAAGTSSPTVPSPAPPPSPQGAGSAAEFYERGAYYFSTGDYDQAARDYRRALELQPEFPAAHNRLGQALLMNGQFAAAAAEFRTAITEKNNDYPAAHYNLGFALQQAGELDESIKAYTAAIENRGGSYPDAYYQIGIIRLNQRRDREAAAALQRAIEQNNGQDPHAYFALGTALARLKEYPTAEAALQTAIAQRGAGFADAHYNLGLLYETNNRVADAIREYETYLQQQPKAFNRRSVEKSLRSLRRRETKHQRSSDPA